MSGFTVVVLCVVVYLNLGKVIANTCESSKPFQIKKQHLNKRLIGHELCPRNVSSHHDCAKECFAIKMCKSIDYYIPEKACILNDADSFSVETTEFESEDGSIFSDITEWPSKAIPTFNMRLFPIRWDENDETSVCFCDFVHSYYAMTGRCGLRPCDLKEKCVGTRDSYTCLHTELIQELYVTNGKDSGMFVHGQLCEKWTFAVGYEMKMESDQGADGDDTTLNGIKLICKKLDGTASNTATSIVGPSGTWRGETYCSGSDSPFFLTSFSLQVNTLIGNGDETGANSIKFKCRDLAGTQAAFELSKDVSGEYSSVDFGTYGHWSSECAVDSAICGLMTRFGVSTGLSDVLFLCCS